MSFRVKLGIAFIGMLLLTGIITLTNWYGMSEALYRQQAAYRLHDELEHRFHELGKAHHNFIIEERDIDARAVIWLLDDLQAKIELLAMTVEQDHQRTLISKIAHLLKQYRQDFTSFNDRSIHKQTMKSRMEAESNRLVATADELAPVGVTAGVITQLITKVLLAEKIYMINKLDENALKVITLAKELLVKAERIVAATESDQIKLTAFRIAKLASVYLATFEKYTAEKKLQQQAITQMTVSLAQFDVEMDQYLKQEQIYSEQGVNHVAQRTVMLSAIEVLLCIVAMLLLSKIITDPIKQLKESANRIVAGKLDTSVKIDSQDEIGDLGRIFNIMTIRLKKNFDDLTVYREHLEELVNERTKDLEKEIEERKHAQIALMASEENLARAKKMEALGLLAGGVAHDLNNVLCGVVSYPELLLMSLPEDSPLKRPLQIIRSSGVKAADIVQDLLTLARRGVVAKETLNLNELVHEYAKSVECEQLKKSYPELQIDTQLDEQLGNIQGSPVHLRKTIVNLVLNAAEAQPSGGVIHISTGNCYLDSPIPGYEQVKTGNYALLTVTDQGIGIEKEDLGRIFEPFYTKKVMGRSGTGLGMAVVWGTVQDHQGYIHISSEKNVGTEFQLYFPVSEATVVALKSPAHIDEYLGHQERILVVDDLAEQREIAEKILTKLNYSVTTLASGEAATDYMKTHKVDLLILDMIMNPGIDGLDTYKNILQLQPQQKAIIASGFAETSRVKEALKCGVSAYVRKPYTIESIGLAVKNALYSDPSTGSGSGDCSGNGDCHTLVELVETPFDKLWERL